MAGAATRGIPHFVQVSGWCASSCHNCVAGLRLLIDDANELPLRQCFAWVLQEDGGFETLIPFLSRLAHVLAPRWICMQALACVDKLPKRFASIRNNWECTHLERI